MIALTRMLCTAAMVAFLVLWIATLLGCAVVEERYTESDCDATPGVELSLGDGGWRVRPTLGC